MKNCLKESRHRSIAVTAIGALSLLLACTAHGQQNYNPTKVLAEMKVPYDKNWSGNRTLVVAAHRGIYRGIKGCPENSACSIGATYNNNIEAIELDVRTSSDGTPWCFHDTTVGRVTNYGSGYNPFNNTGQNPNVSSLSDSTITNLHLKDAISTSNSAGSVSGYYSMSLSRALSLIKSTYPHMAVLLDIKNSADWSAAHKIVASSGISSYVTIKSNWSTFGGSVYSGFTQVPVVGAGDLDNIANEFGRYPTPQAAVNQWMGDYAKSSEIPYVELRMREYDTGPVAATYDNIHGTLGLGSYNPVPEIGNNLYYQSNGSCSPCQTLSSGLAHTTYFGNETLDYREQMTLHTDYFRTTISDEPTALASFANSVGRRYTSIYY